MTHNEALLVLRQLVNMTEDETKIEALEMAIESLNEQYYHKKLKENGYVMTWVRSDKNERS